MGEKTPEGIFICRFVTYFYGIRRDRWNGD